MRKSSLEDELLRDIEEEVETVLQRARNDGEELLRRASKEGEERRKLILRRLEEELEMRRRRRLAREELQGRRALLQLKKEEVERVFRHAGERLAALADNDPERYDAFFAGVFRACRAEIAPGPLRVRTNRVGTLGRRLAGETGLELIEDAAVQGMAIESGDGRQRCDASIATLLDHLRQEREAEIEALLFGDGNERAGE